jgi:adenylosuccinate synthase
MLSTCFLLVSHFLQVWEHVLISGLINPKVNAFIGSGVVVHIPSLFNELDTLERKGEFFTCNARKSLISRSNGRQPVVHI